MLNWRYVKQSFRFKGLILVYTLISRIVWFIRGKETRQHTPKYLHIKSRSAVMSRCFLLIGTYKRFDNVGITKIGIYLMFIEPCIILIVEWRENNLMSLALLFHYLLLNMFRMLIHPSSGACDLFVELFHGLYCSGSMSVGVTLWFGWGGVVSPPSQPNHNVTPTHIEPQQYNPWNNSSNKS